MKEKVAVCYGVGELGQYLRQCGDKNVCLYLAEKTQEAWDVSTSRVYMNQINKNFVYLPVNIKKNDWESIRKVYEIAEKESKIVAINQTQPHKSNPVQKELFFGQNIPKNVDSLIKDKSGKLKCYDLNGPSFVDWFEDEAASFSGAVVVVFGVGGVGEPIARIIAKKGVEKLYLIDLAPKEELVKELSKYANTKYAKSIGAVDLPKSKRIILINCAGKEGGDDEEIQSVLMQLKNLGNIFVDLRPQLNIEIVNDAEKLGWISYTGFGMNSRNDYVLLKKIQEITNVTIPSFAEFKKLVALAS